MFNNKFNSSKSDPLVEAVKQAQQDGDLRRQAEAYVNEEFGVYSRKAVVREHLAAYDAALEEAYKSIKEGKPLDPVGKEDPEGDVNNNGIPAKKDKSDQYLLKRRAAIGKAMGKRMEEEMDGLPPSAAAKEAGEKQEKETPSSTPAPTRTKDLSSTFSSARGAAKMDEEQLDELKKPTAKTAMDAYYRAYDSDVQSGGEGKRTARLGRWKDKHLPGKSARNQKDTGKAEMDDYDRKVVKKGGTLTKASQKDTKGEIKSRLGKHTKPSLPEEYFYEAIARKKDIAKGGVTAPIEYADKMGFANPGAISKLDEAWNKLKEARKCMEEESDTFDFTHLDEAYANYIAEAINEYGLQEEHPVVTAENLYMFNEAYIAAVLGEAAKHEKEKAEDHEEKAKELDEARMRAEKECNEEKEEKEEHDEDTKKRKVLAKTLKHLARKKKMEEELQLDELSAFGAEFAKQRAAGAKTFSFGGKSYTTKLASPTASKGPQNNPGLKGATGFPRTMKTDVGNIKVSPSTPGSGYSQSAERMKAMKPEPTATTPGSMKISAQPAPTAGPSGQEKMDMMSKLPPKPVTPTTPGSAKISAQPAPTAGPSGQDKMDTMNKMSSTPASQTPSLPSMAATPGAVGASLSGGVGGMGGDAGSGSGAGSGGAGGAGSYGGKGGKGGKGGDSLNESVQVGDNKYRIV